VLPFLGNVAIKSDLLPTIEQPLSRAIIAGLAYLVIARASVLDIRVGGEPQGLGFDIIYQQVANYLLHHHNRPLSRTFRDDSERVYTGDSNDPIVFLATTEYLLTQLEDNERQRIQDRIKLALLSEPPTDILCLSLYILIREIVDSNDAAITIRGRRTDVQRNLRSANSLKARLPWLYHP
jgi:hypothetical protein